MSRDSRQRLHDIRFALDEIDRHLLRGPLTDGLVFDAVRIRLVEIGEAVSRLDYETLQAAPHLPWRDIAAMRNHLVHRYFDTAHAIVAATVHHDLNELRIALRTLIDD